MNSLVRVVPVGAKDPVSQVVLPPPRKPRVPPSHRILHLLYWMYVSQGHCLYHAIARPRHWCDTPMHLIVARILRWAIHLANFFTFLVFQLFSNLFLRFLMRKHPRLISAHTERIQASTNTARTFTTNAWSHSTLFPLLRWWMGSFCAYTAAFHPRYTHWTTSARYRVALCTSYQHLKRIYSPFLNDLLFSLIFLHVTIRLIDSVSLRHSGRCATCCGLTHWRSSELKRHLNSSWTTPPADALTTTRAYDIFYAQGSNACCHVVISSFLIMVFAHIFFKN